MSPNSQTQKPQSLDKRSPPIPWFVRTSLFVLVATSGYVMFEPAPCDLLFAVVAPLLLITGYYSLALPMHPLVLIGATLFAATTLISMAMAYEPDVSLRYGSITLYLMALWLLVVSLVAKFGPRAWHVLRAGYLVAATITSSIGVLAGLRLISNWRDFMLADSEQRIRGTFKDSNVLGPFLVAAMAMLIADVVVTRKFKMWQIGCLALYALAILLTFSRGAYLATMVTLTTMSVLFWLSKKYRPAIEAFWIRLIPVGILIGVGAVVVLNQANLSAYFFDRLSYQSYDDERIENQQHILRTVGQMPLGIGPGSWNLHHYLHDVHSLFLRAWVEQGHFGLIGLLCWLSGWAIVTWSGATRSGPLQAVYIVCFAVGAGILSNSFSIDSIHWRHFFLFLAVPVGLYAFEARYSAVAADPQLLSAASLRAARSPSG